MTLIDIILTILAIIGSFILGYEVPHIKKSYKQLKEFREIIKKENKDE